MKKSVPKFDPNHTFFTSDLHFGHANIIKFCHRPFESVEEMNEKLIENWNNVISDDDTVFCLGDIVFGGSAIWHNVIPRLKGSIILIRGNHDRQNWATSYTELFKEVHDQMQIKIENRYIYLNHYPFLCYGGSWRDPKGAVYQLFGHVHSGPGIKGTDASRLANLFPYQYDVGVDNNNYMPISWQQVKEIVEKQVEQSLNS